jgi:hypothetical protein
MRSKTVFFIILSAIILLGGLALLRGLLKQDETPEVAVVSVTETNPAQVVVRTPVEQPTNIVATTPEQDRQAGIEKNLDLLKDALLVGNTNETYFAAVLERFTHPEAEVRQAAVQTAVHLGDARAIPSLKQALQKIEDPKEKAAMIDAIAYLELPDSSTPVIGMDAATGDAPGNIAGTNAPPPGGRPKTRPPRAR